MQADQTVKILLVDDRLENLVTLESVLEDLGQEMVRARSGTEALKRVLEDDFAVILLDVQMPDMDGFETATLIRAREKSRHIPIIFLTAINKTSSHVNKGYSVGAVDYVLKPFEPELLRAKVSAFIDISLTTKRLQAEIVQRRQAEEQLDASNALLETISHALMEFLAEGDLTLTFEHLLNSVLSLTRSEHGFIGEILYTAEREPYLKPHAATRLTENVPMRHGKGQNGTLALDLYDIKALCARLHAEGRGWIATQQSEVPYREGLPRSRQCVYTFLTLPFYKAESLVGMMAIANRDSGYDEALVAYLEPFCNTCASIIDAYRNARRRKQAEEEVRELNEDLECRVTQRTSELANTNRELENEINERRRAEEALAQKQVHVEALNARLQRAMTETHHRVKNNLQIIAAMLDMRVMEDVQSIPTQDIQRLGMHVRTLAAVHDLLTEEAKEDGEARFLSSRDVLERLLPMLQDTAEGRPIQYRIEEVRLSARQGTSLALIVNELISNALKYGRGEIDVELAVVDHTAILQVCDDGPGFPAEFDPIAAANTGLDLVQHLSRWDLGGETQYGNQPEGGACVTVTIPLP